jgi:hypothetical protein
MGGTSDMAGRRVAAVRDHALVTAREFRMGNRSPGNRPSFPMVLSFRLGQG